MQVPVEARLVVLQVDVVEQEALVLGVLDEPVERLVRETVTRLTPPTSLSAPTNQACWRVTVRAG